MGTYNVVIVDMRMVLVVMINECGNGCLIPAVVGDDDTGLATDGAVLIMNIGGVEGEVV